MKLRQFCSALAIGVMALATVTSAQTTGHYPAGAEGLKGASLPPPGVYLRDYNFFYFADRAPRTGAPNDFCAFLYANAPRLIWISDFKILGGYYGADIIVPFYYGKVRAGGQTDTTFTMGDIQVEPITLSWHTKQADFAVGYAFWAPNGDVGKPARILGKGFWSHMLTAGGTFYFDADKNWHLSLLNRYEIHHATADRHPASGNPYTPGNTYTLEWGLGTTLGRVVDVGFIGYYQKQTTPDAGAGTSSAMTRIVGVGPEVAVAVPKAGFFASLRYVYELGAQYRPEGSLLSLTLTKGF